MKTKIAILLIISAIAVSFGATKVSKSAQMKAKADIQESQRPSEPIGGFVAEEH